MNSNKAIGAVVGLLLALSALVIIYLFGAFDAVRIGQPEQEVAQVVPTAGVVITSTSVVTATAEESIIAPLATPTVALTEVPTQEPTVELTAVPTDEPTEIPTMEPTEVPTQEPTTVPTQALTTAPTQEPAPEVAARIDWQLATNGSSDQSLNQVQVWLAFNQAQPAVLLWSDESGHVRFDFEEVPNLGDNDRGYVVFQATATRLAKTEVWFRLDPASNSLVLVKDDGTELNGPVLLFSYDQAAQEPLTWEDSQVWAGCDSVECATEIALTSGYFNPGQIVSCHSEVLNTSSTEQRYRASNGFSVLESTGEHSNYVDALWPDGTPGVSGWRCGNEQGTVTIFVVESCGNIATALQPPE